MPSYTIAVIAGDGVGPEVIAEGKKVLQAVASSRGDLDFHFTDLPWGSDFYRETGVMMPPTACSVCSPTTLFCSALSATRRYRTTSRCMV